MGYRIEVRTKHAESGDAVNQLAQQVDDENLMLQSDDLIPDGEWVAFEVKLVDGSVFFEGMGRCEGSARTGVGWDILLGALQLDTRNGLLYERILLARESLEDGKPTTGLHEIPEETLPRGPDRSSRPPPLPSRPVSTAPRPPQRPPSTPSMKAASVAPRELPRPEPPKPEPQRSEPLRPEPPKLAPEQKAPTPAAKIARPASPSFAPRRTLQGPSSRVESPSWVPPRAKAPPADTETTDLPDAVAQHVVRTEIVERGFHDMEQTPSGMAVPVPPPPEKERPPGEQTEVQIPLPSDGGNGSTTEPPAAPTPKRHDTGRHDATAAVDLGALPAKVREGLISALPELVSTGLARNIEEAHILAVEVGLAALLALPKR